MSEFSVIAVLLVGFLGGVHCLGMCGSIVGMFTTQLPQHRARWPFHLAYSIGRISSYAVAGALVGVVGQAGFLLRDQVPIQHLLFALSSVMLIVLGLYQIYEHFQHLPTVRHMIQGLAAAAAGLLFATGLKMLRPIMKSYLTALTIVLTFIFMLIVKIPLALTLLILLVINFVILGARKA